MNERDYERIGKQKVYDDLLNSIRSEKVTIVDSYSDELKMIDRIITNAKKARRLFVDLNKNELEEEQER